MPALVNSSEATFSQQFLFAILIDYLSWVELPSLVIIVESLSISYIDYIIIMQKNSLLRVNASIWILFIVQLSLHQFKQFVHIFQVIPVKLKNFFLRLSILLYYQLHNDDVKIKGLIEKKAFTSWTLLVSIVLFKYILFYSITVAEKVFKS